MAKNGLKLSTMVGENFEIYMSEMAKNGLKFTQNETSFRFTENH